MIVFARARRITGKIHTIITLQVSNNAIKILMIDIDIVKWGNNEYW